MSFYPDEFLRDACDKGRGIVARDQDSFFFEPGLFPAEYPAFFHGIDHVFRVGIDRHVAPLRNVGRRGL